MNPARKPIKTKRRVGLTADELQVVRTGQLATAAPPPAQLPVGNAVPANQTVVPANQTVVPRNPTIVPANPAPPVVPANWQVTRRGPGDQRTATVQAPLGRRLDALEVGLANIGGLTAQQRSRLADVLTRGREAERRGADLPEVDQALADLDLLRVVGNTDAGADLAQQLTGAASLLRVGGADYPDLTANQARQLGKKVAPHGAKIEAILMYLRTYGAWDLTDEADLIKTVRAIGDAQDRMYTQLANGGRTVPVGTREAWIARRMIEDIAQQDALTQTFGAEASGIAGPQARAVREFLDRNPNFVPNLRAKKISFKFASSKANAYGGGLYLDGVVHMSTMDSAAPGTYMRLLVHETGHASFQRDLLDNNELPTAWDKGNVLRLLRRRSELMKQLAATPPAQGDADAALPAADGPARELAGIQAELAKLDPLPLWGKLSADAKSFYRAWLVLREEDGGNHLFGLDMGDGLRPADRRLYQANTFSEFCAESFMGSATGELDTHVAAVQIDPNASPKVKQAWTDATDILRRLGGPILN